jgi:hypothetical protein
MSGLSILGERAVGTSMTPRYGVDMSTLGRARQTALTSDASDMSTKQVLRQPSVQTAGGATGAVDLSLLGRRRQVLLNPAVHLEATELRQMTSSGDLPQTTNDDATAESNDCGSTEQLQGLALEVHGYRKGHSAGPATMHAHDQEESSFMVETSLKAVPDLDERIEREQVYQLGSRLLEKLERQVTSGLPSTIWEHILKTNPIRLRVEHREYLSLFEVDEDIRELLQDFENSNEGRPQITAVVESLSQPLNAFMDQWRGVARVGVDSSRDDESSGHYSSGDEFLSDAVTQMRRRNSSKPPWINLDKLRIQTDGYAYDYWGQPTAKLIEGNAAEIGGCRINRWGQVRNEGKHIHLPHIQVHAEISR